MSGEIVILADQRPIDNQHILARLEGVLAIFHAMEAGELMAVIPKCDVAERQHRTAVSLLALAERELHELHALCANARP